MSDAQPIGGAVAGSGGGCFRAGTRVQIEGGRTIPIEKLKEGDRVLAFDEDGFIRGATVTKVHYHEDPQPILRVKFWNGEIFATPNHWVLNQYGNFAEIGSLTKHDALVDGMGHLRPIIGAELVGHEPVWNLTVDPHHTFIADGVRVHNGGHRERYPVIAGSGGGSKKGGGGGRAAVEDSDTLQSKAMVSLLDLIGEGEIGGLVNGAQSIFLDGTPLMNEDGSYNFKGVTWDGRTGTQDQEPMSGFSSIETPHADYVQIRKNSPHVVSISNPNVDHVRVIVSVPSLISQDMTTGDVHGTSVQYSIEVATNGGSYQATYADIAWFDGGTWGTEDGHLTAYRKEGSQGLAASIEITGAYGQVVIQPEYSTGSGWQPVGGERTLSKNITGNSETVCYVEAPSGATKLRFRTVSSVGNYQPSPYFGGDTWDAVPSDYSQAPTPTITKKQIRYLSTTSTCTISGKTRSRYQRSHLVTLPKPASNWRIRVTRLTDDSTSSAVSNDLYFDSYVEIVDSKMRYPNSALVGMQVDSSLFSSIPQRSYLVNGLYIQVPSNYDPLTRAYTGIWNGTFKVAVSDNPAWILYDILTNKRYGLGQYLSPSNIDKAKLYQIGKYCDELVNDGYGGLEPRFTINTAIQTQVEAYRLIVDLCSAFNGMSYWAGGMVNFTQDSPTDPSMIYTDANVVEGVFNYSGSSRKDRHSVVLVTWNDPTQNYKQMVEYIEDPTLIARYGVRKLEIVAFGCTSRGQAIRAGKWILYTEQYQSDMIQFRVGIDSAFVVPGDVIKIHDSMRAGKRFGGRIVAVSANSVTLDSAVTLGSGQSTISVRLQDGTFADRVINESRSSSVTTVTFASPLSTLPLVNSMWIISNANLQPILARVIGVAQGENAGEYSITALEHNPSKYAAIEQGLKIEVPTTTVIDIDTVQTPSNLNITDGRKAISENALVSVINVSWTGSELRYELSWRRTGASPTNWETISTSVPNAEIESVVTGTYEFSLVAINGFGKRSASIMGSHSVVITDTTPSSVQNLRLRDNWNGNVATVVWDTVPYASSYKVQVVAQGAVRRDASVTDAEFSYTKEMGIADGGPWRTLTFKVKAVKPSLVESEQWAELTIANQAPTLLGLRIVPGYLSVSVSYKKPFDPDFEGVQIWMSEESGFIPSDSNQVYDGKGTRVTIDADATGIPLKAKTKYYLRIRPYDGFGKNESVMDGEEHEIIPLSASLGLGPGEIVGTQISIGAIRAENLKTKRHMID